MLVTKSISYAVKVKWLVITVGFVLPAHRAPPNGKTPKAGLNTSGYFSGPYGTPTTLGVLLFSMPLQI